MNAYSVSGLTAYIKSLFDEDPELGDVWVEGEVSNCRPAASGHWYFVLKDDGATVNCVIWRGQAAVMATLPADGRRFLMHGGVSVYGPSGRYQYYVDHCEPAGQGDLHQQFEALKARLAEEGLFDASRKRPLPPFPTRIGIVTSRQAAALRDICNVLARRWPVAEVFVAPTLVQGDAAPEQIVAALDAIARAGVDVVLLARGGGSLEDLWAFNDEQVARAIAACPVPVVCGVGHEIDFTIADFAADVRAPTPSAAAELATPDGRELRLAIDDRRLRLDRGMADRIDAHREGVDRLAHRLRLAAPERTIRDLGARAEALHARLDRAVGARLRLARADLDGRARRLAALSPEATLRRGYAHVSRARDGRAVAAVGDVRSGEAIRVRVIDGAFDAVVTGQGRLFD